MEVEVYRDSKSLGLLLDHRRLERVTQLPELPRLESLQVCMIPRFPSSYQTWPQVKSEEYAELLKTRLLEGRKS